MDNATYVLVAMLLYFLRGVISPPQGYGPEVRPRHRHHRPSSTPIKRTSRRHKRKRRGSGPPSKKKRKKKKRSARGGKDALTNMFHKFDFDESWKECTEDPISKLHIHKLLVSQKSICDHTKHLFQCVPPKKKQLIGLDGPTTEINFQAAFGVYSVAVVIVPVPHVKVMTNCKAVGEWKIRNCRELTIRSSDEPNFFLFKRPATARSWTAHHDLGRYQFYDPLNPSVKLRPFPVTGDFPAFMPDAKLNFIILEHFVKGVSLGNMFEFLEEKQLGPQMIKDILFRCSYIANLWFIAFNRMGFEHRDFHLNNMMFDFRQITLPDFKLTRIGINHFYAIDLDTMKYPGCDVDALNKDVVAAGQGTVADSGQVLSIYSVSLSDGKWVDSKSRDMYAELTRIVKGLCDDPEVGEECDMELQLKAEMTACEYALYETHATGKTHLVAGLPSCSDMLRYVADTKT